ncbi:MAG: sterol desaturase family protein, partial [Altibacter sp.]|nr:sterol desaturase family protein [Altibacter sp.]
PWTDTNYGNMLSIWDRMFGTFSYENVDDIQYGLDISDHTDDENFGVQLRIPFNKRVVSKKS